MVTVNDAVVEDVLLELLVLVVVAVVVAEVVVAVNAIKDVVGATDAVSVGKTVAVVVVVGTNTQLPPEQAPLLPLAVRQEVPFARDGPL